MSDEFPQQDLTCPDPKRCTVAVQQLTSLAQDGDLSFAFSSGARHWFRVYDSVDGYGSPNPGYGDTRFAPFDSSANKGDRVPTMYLAESLEAALLETSLHDIHAQEPRVISEASLLGMAHARVVPPFGLRLVDLRDDRLKDLGLVRESISSSSTEHYPCTRRVARAIHEYLQDAEGIVWHSRQAELNGKKAAETAVIFADRVPTTRGAWTLAPSRNAHGALLEGAGRLLLDELAESLKTSISGPLPDK